MNKSVCSKLDIKNELEYEIQMPYIVFAYYNRLHEHAWEMENKNIKLLTCLDCMCAWDNILVAGSK